MSSELDVSRIERQVQALSMQTQALTQSVDRLNPKVEHISSELEKLRDDFNAMVNEQRRSAAIQRATTELVRIRQEIDQKFGNYKVVRETMLGVLQATDLALVKKTTISRVSEEIMLATPEYWLAPCLVAVAAWIGNDKDLAGRAIAEAVKRDDEKTSLTMALICRRNNRADTCYEWLSRYFSRQDSNHLHESAFTYIDAYINGVFGPDKKHTCDDYIAKWMNEVRGSRSRLDQEQEAMWRSYCGNFSADMGETFPDLKACVAEYDSINGYVGRIRAVEDIKNNFAGINNAYVNTDDLKKKVDKTLVDLIGEYDRKEMPLLREERIATLAKEDGDWERAKQIVRAKEEMKKERTLDLVEQMTNAIVSDKEQSPSKRKTAVHFLSGYIQNGFKSYITEKKEAFPKEISMTIDGWSGTTATGEDADRLCADYERAMTAKMQQEDAAMNRKKPQQLTILAAVLAVAGVLGLIVAAPIGVALLVAAAGTFFAGVPGAKKGLVKQEEQIQQSYAETIEQGKRRIQNTAEQWRRAKKIVEENQNVENTEIIA